MAPTLKPLASPGVTGPQPACAAAAWRRWQMRRGFGCMRDRSPTIPCMSSPPFASTSAPPPRPRSAPGTPHASGRSASVASDDAQAGEAQTRCDLVVNGLPSDGGELQRHASAAALMRHPPVPHYHRRPPVPSRRAPVPPHRAPVPSRRRSTNEPTGMPPHPPPQQQQSQHVPPHRKAPQLKPGSLVAKHWTLQSTTLSTHKATSHQLLAQLRWTRRPPAPRRRPSIKPPHHEGASKQGASFGGATAPPMLPTDDDVPADNISSGMHSCRRPAPSAPSAPAEANHSSKWAQLQWQKAGRIVQIASDSQRVPRLARSAPPEMLEAAASFDDRFRTNTARLKRTNHILRRTDKMRPEAAPTFARQLHAVQRQRLVIPERTVEAARSTKHGTVGDMQAGYAGVTWRRWSSPREEEAAAPESPRASRPKAFDPYQSIWSPRVPWCDSKDLYDSRRVELQRFANDWRRCLRLGVTRLIMRVDDDGAADDDGDGIPDEVEQVGEVFSAFHDLLFSLFSFYACIYGHDVHHITWNAFKVVPERLVLNERCRGASHLLNAEKAHTVFDSRTPRLSSTTISLWIRGVRTVSSLILTGSSWP